jgi:type IV pilus assembly protein PilC
MLNANMNYRYEAFDKNGQRQTGVLVSPDETAAEKALWQQGLTIVRLAPARPRASLRTLLPSFFGVKRQDLIIFSRQLATLIESGIGILTGLQLLLQSSGSALREVLIEVVQSLQQGQALSAAMAAHPLAFPPLYTRTLAVGERTGHLEDALRQLATFLEKEQALSRKLRDAATYPAVVLGVAVFVVVIVVAVALPPIVDLFDSFHADLPVPTKILIGFSKFASGYGALLIFGAIVLGVVAIYYGSTPNGRRLRDRVFLRLPVIGKVILQGQVARFTRTAAVLIRAGLPLTEVMELILQTVDNTAVYAALDRVRLALLAGQGFAGPLAAEQIFPLMLSQMVMVGEVTGTLEANLATLADFYEDETDRSVKNLAALMEPALTILVGGVVGFISIAIVTPMYSVLSSIK